MTPTKLPLVSIIVPVYNGFQYLSETLQSALSQSYQPFELIVVNDGSIDKSDEIATSFEKVRYFYQQHQGVSAARNLGIKVAKGEMIAFLDADDIWEPNKLTVQVEYMLQHPHLGFSATNFINFVEAGIQPPAWFRPDSHLGEISTYIPSTLVVTKQTLEKVGHFSLAYQASEDIEWLVRARQHRVLSEIIPEALTRRRLHGSNLSWQQASGHSIRALKIATGQCEVFL
ncbi:MAG: glycosyltransferase family A protein [Phormidesmis sp.]